MQTTMTTAEQKQGSRRGPERTCARCRQSIDVSRAKKTAGGGGAIRWVVGPEGEVFPDLAARSWGRGAWIHAHPRCLTRLSQSLARSFKSRVVTSDEDAIQRLAQAAEQRAWQLLGSARRRGLLAVGGSEVEEAWQAGRAKLALVARDARAVAETDTVRAAISAGVARVWGDKASLGRLLGRSEVGVVAITDQRLADGVFDAIAMALLASGILGSQPAAIGDEASVPNSNGSGGSTGRNILTEVE